VEKENKRGKNRLLEREGEGLLLSFINSFEIRKIQNNKNITLYKIRLIYFFFFYETIDDKQFIFFFLFYYKTTI
jgi:hypothetical protein